MGCENTSDAVQSITIEGLLAYLSLDVNDESVKRAVPKI